MQAMSEGADKMLGGHHPVPKRAKELPLLYKSLTALDPVRHRDLLFHKIGHYGFSRDTNSVPLLLSEFAAASACYPIAFAKTGKRGTFFPVAVLGVSDRENRFLSAENMWLAEYVPAWIRRYPFHLGAAPQGQPGPFALQIDETAEHFRGPAGQPLLSDTGPESVLSEALVFSFRYEQQTQPTLDFANAVHAAGLLVQKSMTQDDTRLSYWTIDPARLIETIDDFVSAWISNGFLAAVIRVVASAERWIDLDRLPRRPAPQDSAAVSDGEG